MRKHKMKDFKVSFQYFRQCISVDRIDVIVRDDHDLSAMKDFLNISSGICKNVILDIDWITVFFKING